MLDFLDSTIITKNRETYLCPVFKIGAYKDLMIKGGSFYAIYDNTTGLWSTDINHAVRLIDEELREHKKVLLEKGSDIPVKYLGNDFTRGSYMDFLKYTNNLSDNYKKINQKIIFNTDSTSREDYATFKLPYTMHDGPTPLWDELVDILYGEEREKIEWTIGAIASNEISRHQKFLVFFGPPGSGKSTVLKIIEGMFDGYFTHFSAKTLGSNERFALEPFTNFPLLAIDHDADLSRIESNVRINTLVSHEPMVVDEKNKKIYVTSFDTLLMIGTNNPVKITDSKSGLLRRLIDIHPTKKTIPFDRYNEIVDGIKFEYGSIAKKCADFYKRNRKLYLNYVPTEMIGATNHLFNFFDENSQEYYNNKWMTLKRLWSDYKKFVEESGISYPLNKMTFKNEAKEYYNAYYDVKRIPDAGVCKCVYEDFKVNKFFNIIVGDEEKNKLDISGGDSDDDNKTPLPDWLNLKNYILGEPNKLDLALVDCFAQESKMVDDREVPKYKWENVKTRLIDIDTTKVHFVKVPINHIVIDFDIKDENGNKSLEKNLEAAARFPPTYAEVSKSGSGVHLHYIYDGDPNKLSRVYDDNIEIKVFTGNSSLRRKLTMCNDLDISTISSGLPLKEETRKMLDKQVVFNEKALRTFIKRNLMKEYHSDTSSSINFIFKGLEDAYNSGVEYDVSDLTSAIMQFAMQSTNQSARCMNVVSEMHFMSKDKEELEEEKRVGSIDSEVIDISRESFRGSSDDPEYDQLVFFDVEVFPNLFVVVWKKQGKENECITWINPTASQIEELVRYKLVGFNNRGYDNHILYAAILGYSNYELYKLSKKLISDNNKNAKFREAFNLSYTDIYDFASAGNKQSLKKWEVALGIHHLELGLPWDDPVDESLWSKVAEYCCNDVVSTEATFDALKGDYAARLILADLVDGTANDTTNQLTTKLMFGSIREPQGEFCYRDLSKPVTSVDEEVMAYLKEFCPNMVADRFDDKSVLPYFDGYSYENGVSTYKGRKVGEGGYVYAEPGIYYNVALIDITSMHPHSTIAECLFGPRFTRTFYALVYARVYIKHEEWDKVRDILEGKLSPYVDKILAGEINPDDLSLALKTAINSVYGLTAAKFNNKFRDERNIDNIVAKRGALFMVDLEDACKARGMQVVHIKTDSIKIANATSMDISFVMEFGERYGYHFEHECTYDRICLINDSVYIAKYVEAEKCQEQYGYVPKDNRKHPGEWTATGARFAEPFIFKTLFSHQEVTFDDLCLIKNVQTYITMDFNEGMGISDHDYRFVGKVGSFVPVIDGVGGAIMYKMAEKKEKGEDGSVAIVQKLDSVNGTKGYRWLESEVARGIGGKDIVDKEYYRRMADEAIDIINTFGSYDEFVS